jgi:hypothetical protein
VSQQGRDGGQIDMLDQTTGRVMPEPMWVDIGHIGAAATG